MSLLSVPHPRRVKTSKTVGYFVAFVGVGLMAAVLGPTLPGLAENTGTQLGQIGFLFTAHSLGYLLGSFLGGRLYDRTPGHNVMAAALMLMALLLALIPLVTWLWALAGAWLVLGMAAGALDVGGNTLLVWVHGRQVGPFMNALHFFFGVGAFLSPVIVAQALSFSGDITWAYWILALLVLPGLFWLLRLPSPGAASSSEPGASDGSHFTLVLLVALLLCLYVGGEVSFGGWVFSYALALDLSSEAAAAYLTSGFWGALTVGRLLTIPLAARFRPRVILAASLAGCLVGVGIVLAWPASVVALWLGTLWTGLSMASIFPSSFSLAERHVPITGRVSGWFMVGSSLGGMALPWLIGQLFERIGPRVTMLAIMIDIVVAVGVFVVLVVTLPRVSRRSELEADQDR